MGEEGLSHSHSCTATARRCADISAMAALSDGLHSTIVLFGSQTVSLLACLSNA